MMAKSTFMQPKKTTSPFLSSFSSKKVVIPIIIMNNPAIMYGVLLHRVFFVILPLLLSLPVFFRPARIHIKPKTNIAITGNKKNNGNIEIKSTKNTLVGILKPIPFSV